jgi:hypothetical protein
MLPIKTTGEDIEQIVSYLKTKPMGATLSDARAVVKKQALDTRKLAAYRFWGFTTQDGDRLKLTPRGWNLARKPSDAKLFYREAIDSVVPYRSVLEWAHHQGFDSLTNIDVVSHWHEHHSSELGTENENTINEQAICFFRLCEAAELGSLTVGRSGKQTRLSIRREELSKLIESGPSAPPWQLAAEENEEAEEAEVHEVLVAKEAEDKLEASQVLLAPRQTTIPEKVRVFISHGKNTDLVEQVETMLGLAEIESEVAVKEETSAIPVPEKIFAAMRRCEAGIIIVSKEEGNRDVSGNYGINDNVLIEIGAAFVLYDRRVVLLWDKDLPVPSNLQGLYRCEFTGEELSWSAGMKLMKAIKGFKA